MNEITCVVWRYPLVKTKDERGLLTFSLKKIHQKNNRLTLILVLYLSIHPYLLFINMITLADTTQGLLFYQCFSVSGYTKLLRYYSMIIHLKLQYATYCNLALKPKSIHSTLPSPAPLSAVCSPPTHFVQPVRY